MKLFYTSTLLAFLLMFFLPTDSRTFSQQPPIKATGAPGESDCGNGQCHNQTALEPPTEVSVTYNNNELTYDGQVKEITITLNFPDKNKFGFEMTALSELGEGTPGAFITNNTSSQTILTAKVEGATREYICHFMASSTNSWTFQWESPNQNLGDITFYYAINASDGNNNPGTGDNIYKGSFVVTSTMVGINDFNSSSLVSVNQKSNSNLYQLNYNNLTAGAYLLSVYDVFGRNLLNHQIEVNNKAGLVNFELESLQSNNQIIIFNLIGNGFRTTVKHLHN